MICTHLVTGSEQEHSVANNMSMDNHHRNIPSAQRSGHVNAPDGQIVDPQRGACNTEEEGKRDEDDQQRINKGTTPVEKDRWDSNVDGDNVPPTSSPTSCRSDGDESESLTSSASTAPRFATKKLKELDGERQTPPTRRSARSHRRLTRRAAQAYAANVEENEEDGRMTCRGTKRTRRETLPDIAERISVARLRPCMKKSLVAASKELGISATTLKRLCRHYGIKRWPYRQLSGIDRSVHRLENELEASLKFAPAASMREPIVARIRELEVHRKGMIKLALEGGHEPIRAKLASISTFVSTIQGARESPLSSSLDEDLEVKVSDTDTLRSTTEDRQQESTTQIREHQSPAESDKIPATHGPAFVSECSLRHRIPFDGIGASDDAPAGGPAAVEFTPSSTPSPGLEMAVAAAIENTPPRPSAGAGTLSTSVSKDVPSSFAKQGTWSTTYSCRRNPGASNMIFAPSQRPPVQSAAGLGCAQQIPSLVHPSEWEASALPHPHPVRTPHSGMRPGGINTSRHPGHHSTWPLQQPYEDRRFDARVHQFRREDRLLMAPATLERRGGSSQGLRGPRINCFEGSNSFGQRAFTSVGTSRPAHVQGHVRYDSSASLDEDVRALGELMLDDHESCAEPDAEETACITMVNDPSMWGADYSDVAGANTGRTSVDVSRPSWYASGGETSWPQATPPTLSYEPGYRQQTMCL